VSQHLRDDDNEAYNVDEHQDDQMDYNDILQYSD
jgi:hypothetical protein